MSSGSGNTVRILGATTTTAGIAILPATSGQGWLAVTMISIIAGGLAMVTFFACASVIKRLN
jgi:hypothetical protein